MTCDGGGLVRYATVTSKCKRAGAQMPSVLHTSSEVRWERGGSTLQHKGRHTAYSLQYRESRTQILADSLNPRPTLVKAVVAVVTNLLLERTAS
jgi:hypothetical protein